MRHSQKPRLYVVATSHLDTQWRWTIGITIRHFLKRTLIDNFERFKEFPDYVLSFEGALRYKLVEEYYPDLFEELRTFVRQGRWRVSGSMWEAPDTNIPSPESLIRHVLYGNDYFRRKFGRTSTDVFLPDCFGFPWSLPTIAVHCGLTGFSSQKLLKWIKPSTIPFDIGLWEGPDGSRLTAVLDPGGYGETLREDLSRSRHWLTRFEKKKAQGRPTIGYKYFGVGDRGGAPDRRSLDWLEKSADPASPIEIIHSGSDQLFRDLTPETKSQLPLHRGELLLPTHGTGCWTSQAAVKKWNRKCEVTAEAAERAALAAEWLGGTVYPRQELLQEWTRFLGHQMHDDLTGTSAPEVYRVSWNDQLLALNRLRGILADSVASASRSLDTNTPGEPLVVYNQLGFERTDLVEAWVSTPQTAGSPQIFNDRDEPVPTQVLEQNGQRTKILFEALVPPVGFAVYDVRAAERRSQTDELGISEGGIENHKYRVTVDRSGSIVSIFDKTLDRELLSRPAELILLLDQSSRWPAWEILHDDLCAEEQVFEAGEARVVERGPLRVALETTRRHGKTTVVQRVSLASGAAGDRLDISNTVDWQSRGALLKARFSVAAEDPQATYDLGLGTIERGVNEPARHEVPGHDWADLSEGNRWGVSVLSRDKYGWDRPATDTLRLSLLRSPKAFRRFAHQAIQDLGRHSFSYAIYSHPGGVHQADTVRAGAGFNQPLLAFRARRHLGPVGRSFSLLQLDGTDTDLMALKKAENSPFWLARIREVRNQPAAASKLSSPVPFERVWRSDGSESRGETVKLENGTLAWHQNGFSPAAFLIAPAANPEPPFPATQQPLTLPFDTTATSFHGQRPARFDRRGHSIPGELFPEALPAGALRLPLGPTQPGEANAMACRGQRLALPPGEFDHLTLIAASTDPKGNVIRIDGTEIQGSLEPSLRIPYYSGLIGQWKTYSGRLGFLLRRWSPGFCEQTPVAWSASHRHDRRLNDQAHVYCYLFRFDVGLVDGACDVGFPNQPAVKVFSAVAAQWADFRLESADSSS